jgi:hypothetical protein
MRRTLSCTALLIAAALLTSCGHREAEKPITLPPTPALSVRAHWGVAKSPYLRAFDGPSTDGKVVFLLRAGDILEITAKSGYTDQVRAERDYWYHVIFEKSEGWVFGAGLDLYESRERAENASRLLTNG